MHFRSERFFLSGYFVLAISFFAFSMPLVHRELVKQSSTQEHSGVMLGVNPGRTRAVGFQRAADAGLSHSELPAPLLTTA